MNQQTAEELLSRVAHEVRTGTFDGDKFLKALNKARGVKKKAPANQTTYRGVRHSGYIGVQALERKTDEGLVTTVYRATFQQRNLGTYLTAMDAAKARDEAVKVFLEANPDHVSKKPILLNFPEDVTV